MSDEVKLSDQELAAVAGGAASDDLWLQNGHWLYCIKPGDTLSGIAVTYGTTVKKLMALNPDKITNPDFICSGWIIRIY